MARRSSSTLRRGEVESDETGNKEAAGEHAGLLKIADVSPTLSRREYGVQARDLSRGNAARGRDAS